MFPRNEKARWHPPFASLVGKGILEEFVSVRILADGSRKCELGAGLLRRPREEMPLSVAFLFSLVKPLGLEPGLAFCI